MPPGKVWHWSTVVPPPQQCICIVNTELCHFNLQFISLLRPDQIHLLLLGFFKLENGPTDRKKTPLINALQNFIDSGLITTAMVLFTHAQEEVSEGNVQSTKENFGE